MSTANAHKSAIREYQRANPGVTFPEARRATDRNQIPRVRIGESAGKPVWLDLGPGSVTPIIGPTGAGKRSTLRHIAASVASARADVEVVYLTNRGKPNAGGPSGTVRWEHRENTAVYLRTLVQERTAAALSSLRPLVVVVDEVAPQQIAAVAFLAATFRGLKMHAVLGAQGEQSAQEWMRAWSTDASWRFLLGQARTWVYVNYAPARTFIGSVAAGLTAVWMEFDRYDETSASTAVGVSSKDDVLELVADRAREIRLPRESADDPDVSDSELDRPFETEMDMLRANREYWLDRGDLVMVRSLDEALVDAGMDPGERQTCGGCGAWAHPGKPSPVGDCDPTAGRRWATGPYLT